MLRNNQIDGLDCLSAKKKQTKRVIQPKSGPSFFSAALRPFLRSQEVLRRIGARIIVELALISARPLAYLAQARDGQVLIPSRERRNTRAQALMNIENLLAS